MTYSKLVPAAIKALGAGLLVCYSAPLTLTFFREPYDWDDWNYMYGHPATIGNGVALEIQLAHIFFLSAFICLQVRLAFLSSIFQPGAKIDASNGQSVDG